MTQKLNRLHRMGKCGLAALMLSVSISAIASNKFAVAVGLGMPYGGFLGVNVAYPVGPVNLEAGAGLLGYTSVSGARPGYSIGANMAVSPRNVVGIRFGTTSMSYVSGFFGDDTAIYHGIGLSYTYFFSGSSNSSWHLGAEVTHGKTRNKSNVFSRDKEKLGIIVGYQF